MIKQLISIIVLLVVAVIFLSIFFGFGGGGLFRKTGEAAEKAIELGPLKIGAGEFEEASVEVPAEVSRDYENLVNAFKKAATTYKNKDLCYISIKKIENIGEGEGKDFGIRMLSPEGEFNTTFILYYKG